MMTILHNLPMFFSQELECSVTVVGYCNADLTDAANIQVPTLFFPMILGNIAYCVLFNQDNFIFFLFLQLITFLE